MSRLKQRPYWSIFVNALLVCCGVLAAVLTFIVNRIEVHAVPKRRTHDDTNKEVNQA